MQQADRKIWELVLDAQRPAPQCSQIIIWMNVATSPAVNETWAVRDDQNTSNQMVEFVVAQNTGMHEWRNGILSSCWWSRFSSHSASGQWLTCNFCLGCGKHTMKRKYEWSFGFGAQSIAMIELLDKNKSLLTPGDYSDILETLGWFSTNRKIGVGSWSRLWVIELLFGWPWVQRHMYRFGNRHCSSFSECGAQSSIDSGTFRKMWVAFVSIKQVWYVLCRWKNSRKSSSDGSLLGRKHR